MYLCSYVVKKLALFGFRRANPQAINIELNASTWTANQSIVIKTLLTRTDGKVTLGQPAYFQAWQTTSSGQVNVGRFEGLLNNVSNNLGQLADVKLILDTPNLDATKPINVQGKALNDAGDTLRMTMTIPHL